MPVAKCSDMRNSMLFALLPALMLATGCRSVGNYFADRGRDLADTVRLQAGVGPGIGVNVRAAGTLQAGLVVGAARRDLGVGLDYGELRGVFAPDDKRWDGEASASVVGWGIIGTATLLAGLTGGPGAAAAAPGVQGLSTPRDLDRDGRPDDRGGPPHPAALMLFGYSYIEGTDRPVVSPRASTRDGFLLFDGLAGFVRDPTRDEVQRVPTAARAAGLEPDQTKLWLGRSVRVNKRAHLHAFNLEGSAYAGLVYAKAGVSPGEAADFVLGIFGLDIAGDDGR